MTCTEYATRLFVECVPMTYDMPTTEPNLALLDLTILTLAAVLIFDTLFTRKLRNPK